MARKKVNKKSKAKRVTGRNPSKKGKESKVRKLIRLAKARLLKKHSNKKRKNRH